jgi:hypothetical protein
MNDIGSDMDRSEHSEHPEQQEGSND